MTNAVIAALLLSCLIVAIEITKSANSSLLGILRVSTLLYFVVAAVGNISTTALAAATTSHQIPTNVVPDWFWYAFLGVFGFEAILKKVSLTFAGIGVLSINDWITKAKDSATADVIEAGVVFKEQRAQSLAMRLTQLSVTKLNAHVINILGAEQVAVLDSLATQCNADPQFLKALALAKGNYNSSIAILPK